MAADAGTAVVGGGPAGLATAATLVRAGRPVTLLERGDQVGASWIGRYDSLHLHTVRWLSGLPGMRIPRDYGRWVGRDHLIEYLQEYARSYGLRPELGVIVERIDRGKDGAWQVTTNAGVRVFSQVVVATGCSHTPRLPDWPGLDSFPGEVIHSADYREPSSYAGRDVLVVGSGNSATEIALDLLGADAKVRLSVRTPPTILRRDVFGLPIQLLGIGLTKAPATVINPLLTGMRRISIPDLSAQGLPRTQNPYTHFLETGVVPIIDTGIVAAIRSRQIQVVAAPVLFDGRRVQLSDGSTVEPDAVIAGTGYTNGLEPMVGHLAVLDSRSEPLVDGADQLPNAMDLYFVGLKPRVAGLLWEIGIQAQAIGRAIARLTS